ncbi:hypothetical protein ACA910_019426 [Epithemia clementina (nom. ined.)]
MKVGVVAFWDSGRLEGEANGSVVGDDVAVWVVGAAVGDPGAQGLGGEEVVELAFGAIMERIMKGPVRRFGKEGVVGTEVG